MNAPAPKQDIDSGTGEVITPGEPVDHVDVVDGQSAGHSIEPEADPPAEVHEPGQTVTEKPPGVSLDDIYGKAKDVRESETDEALGDMNAADRANYQRMVAEAQGLPDDDPFDGDGQVIEGRVAPSVAPAGEMIPAPAAAAPAPATVQPALDTQPETTTIVVYGMKQEVPTAEVNAAGGVASYQKIVAADERMRRASTYEASVRAYDQEVQTRAASLAATPQATSATAAVPELPPTDAQGETVDMQAQAERLVGAMYTGDREAAITQAAEVLTEIQTSVVRAAQNANPQPVAPVVSAEVDRVAQERARAAIADRAEANQVFVTEFTDLSSPVLRQATYAMVQAVAAEPIMYGRPLAEITREAGARVRADVFGDAAPAPAPLAPAPTAKPVVMAPASPTLASRMELKSRTVVQPLIPAHGKFTEPAVEGQETESNTQYIARMKVNRGQHA
jgi:hypothetical protein